MSQLLKGPEVLFDGIEILRVIAMKARAWFPVFVLDLVRAVVVVIPGCEPERGYSEFLQVREAAIIPWRSPP